MTWVRIDDAMPDSLKISPLSDAAFRAYVTSICYSARNLTDGFIPSKKAREFSGKPRVVQELVPALWEPSEGGFTVHDYLDFNPTREQVLAERSEKHAQKVAAGSKGAAKRWQKDSSAIAEPLANAWQNDSPVPVPDPVPLLQQLPQQQRGDVERQKDEIAASFARYGNVTSGTPQSIDDDFEEFGVEWVKLAVKAGAMAAHREGPPHWGFVHAILQRYQDNGGPDEPKRERPGASRGVVASGLSAGERFAARLSAR